MIPVRIAANIKNGQIFILSASVPETMDISDEPDHILQMYGPNAQKPGTYAANCIQARRLIEKDVRFVQLYHMGWGTHIVDPHL